MPESLSINDDGEVRLVTLNRPAAKNAFNAALYSAVGEALLDAAADPTVKACVITGEGDVFSAGQDLKGLATTEGMEAESRAFVPFTESLAAFDKPLLAAVNGAAVGVGVTLLLHCDVVLVSESSRFRLPFASLGLVPEAASTVLLPARVGPQAAAYYLLTGDWMSAEDAVALGLAWNAYPADRLVDEAVALARRISKASAGALTSTKRLLLAARSEAVTNAFVREQAALSALSRRRLMI